MSGEVIQYSNSSGWSSSFLLTQPKEAAIADQGPIVESGLPSKPRRSHHRIRYLLTSGKSLTSGDIASQTGFPLYAVHKETSALRQRGLRISLRRKKRLSTVSPETRERRAFVLSQIQENVRQADIVRAVLQRYPVSGRVVSNDIAIARKQGLVPADFNTEVLSPESIQRREFILSQMKENILQADIVREVLQRFPVAKRTVYRDFAALRAKGLVPDDYPGTKIPTPNLPTQDTAEIGDSLAEFTLTHREAQLFLKVFGHSTERSNLSIISPKLASVIIPPEIKTYIRVILDNLQARPIDSEYSSRIKPQLISRDSSNMLMYLEAEKRRLAMLVNELLRGTHASRMFSVKEPGEDAAQKLISWLQAFL